MNFDITKSKLYSQIMEGAAKFFGLGETATEAEVHQAFEGQKPLPEQLDAARAEATEATKAELADVTERLKALEQAQTAAAAAVTAKDERIAELQQENAGFDAKVTELIKRMEAQKQQHETETRLLAGKVSALSAGRVFEQAPADDAHAASTEAADPNLKIIPLENDDLKAMVKKRQPQL